MPESAGAAAAAAAVHSNIEWIKIQTNTAIYLKGIITEMDKFNGNIGELHHFLKRGDQINLIIERRVAAGTVDTMDAIEIKASLAGRVNRSILNEIQADEFTAWAVIKEKLKMAYGGGRWTPEEDMYSLLTLRRDPHQSDGQYAEEMIIGYNRIANKVAEKYEKVEATARMAFLSSILKVQLEKNMKNKNPLPAAHTFMQAAQEIMERGAKEEEERYKSRNEEPWTRVERRRREERPRTYPKPREPDRRDFGRNQEKRNYRGAEHRREYRAPRQRERKCYECGRTGHLAAQCSKSRCFECGKRGHLARECPWIYRREKDEPERMEVNFQNLRRRSNASPTPSSDNEDSSSSTSSSTTRGGRFGRKKMPPRSRDTTTVVANRETEITA